MASKSKFCVRIRMQKNRGLTSAHIKSVCKSSLPEEIPILARIERGSNMIRVYFAQPIVENQVRGFARALGVEYSDLQESGDAISFTI